MSLLAAGCTTDIAEPEVPDLDLPAPQLGLTQSDVTTAVPVAAYLGAGSVVSTIEVGINRGLIHSDVFSVQVTVVESDGTPRGTKTFILSEATVYGSVASQTNIGLFWDGDWELNADHFLYVCATVLIDQGDGTTEFSAEVCSNLIPAL